MTSETGHRCKHVLRVTLGVLCLILGVLGLFLPILQGILFLVLGIALLAPYVPLFRRWREWLYRRFPRTKVLVRKARYIGYRMLHPRSRRGN